MDQQSFLEKSVLLTDISPYVYGTIRLGDSSLPFDERLEIAKAAIDTGIWFQSSHWYGDALSVLNAAFDSDRTKVPKLIVKLGGETIDELRTDINKNMAPLGITDIEIGQLCIGGQLAEEFAAGGKCYNELQKIKSEGLVKRFVVEAFPWTSDLLLRALKGGYTKGIVDGVIFTMNPLQRFVSNELWDFLREESEPIIALRTIAGGHVHSIRDIQGFTPKRYLQERAAEVAPIFEKSGVKNWTEFCVRFAHSFSQIRATVGSTSNAENLIEYLSAAESIEPLSYDIVDSIVKLQYRWTDEFDSKAEPWTL